MPKIRIFQQIDPVILLILSVSLSILLVCFGLSYVWPSQSQLCRSLIDQLPKDICMGIEVRPKIIDQAFPIGTATSADVKEALGYYLIDEYPTSNGHTEWYQLEVSITKLLFDNVPSYFFSYDNDGVLIRFSYED